LAAQVLHNFDLDACGFMFDGEQIWATERAIHAFRTGVQIVDPRRASLTYGRRLAKYNEYCNLTAAAAGIGGDIISAFLARIDKKFKDVEHAAGS
jgi:hypothetical protein